MVVVMVMIMIHAVAFHSRFASVIGSGRVTISIGR